MARTLTETLVRESHTLIGGHVPAFHLRSLHPPSSRLLNLRGRSGRPEKLVQIFELDLEAEGAGSGASPEAAAARREAAARRLEDVIHGIVVRRAAPDWLPFIPGSSYWVPPRSRARSRRLVELLGRVSCSLTEEEVMSLTTVRGWPCASHLMGDVPPYMAENCPKEESDPSEDEDS